MVGIKCSETGPVQEMSAFTPPLPITLAYCFQDTLGN